MSTLFRLLSYCLFLHSCFIRIIGIITPFEPAAIENRHTRPAHQPGIEKSFTTAPACSTIKCMMLIGGNTGFFPNIINLMKFACGVVNISLIFHMISIRAAISENSTRNTSFLFNIIVTAHLANVFGQTSHANQFGILRF